MGACHSAPGAVADAALLHGAAKPHQTAVGGAKAAELPQAAGTDTGFGTPQKFGVLGQLSIDSSQILTAASNSLASVGDSPPSSAPLSMVLPAFPTPLPLPATLATVQEGQSMRMSPSMQSLVKQPQPQYEAVTVVVRQLFDAPIAGVALIDDQLQAEPSQGPVQCDGSCGCTLRSYARGFDHTSLLVVEDAAEDERFKALPQVAGESGVRFYAGAPLQSIRDGRRYGTLCAIDFQPRSFPPEYYQLLCRLSDVCVREMEQEQQMQQQQKVADKRLHRALECFFEGVGLLDLSSSGWRVLYANAAFRAAAGMPPLLGPEDSAPAVDFWSTFAHVTDGKNSHAAALAALMSRQQFTMAVKPGSLAANCSGQPPVLQLLFRPVDSEPNPGASLEINGDGGPLLYFGIVQSVDRPAQQPTSGTLSSASSGALPGFTSEASLGLEVLINHGSTGNGMRRNSSQTQLVTQAETGGMVPSVFAMRPEVMKEVTLGPLIGSGSAGRCYRAAWQGGRVAVKIIDCKIDPGSGKLSPTNSLPLEQVGDSTKPAAEAALVEALLARSLSHPHIITTYCHAVSKKQCHTSGELRQQVWIVQEFCSRGSLLDAIDKGLLQRPGGGPNLPAILTAALEIAGACLYLHNHDIVHGDLTPGNVLLASSSRDARRWVCKVGDFGLAQIIHNDAQPLMSTCFGTVTHAAPELVIDGVLTKAADVYSFGVIVLEMYNSRRAWKGYSFMQILSSISAGTQPLAIPTDCPDALACLLCRCLDKHPAGRPTFATVLEDLHEMLRMLQRPRSSATPFHPQAPTAVSVRGPSTSCPEHSTPPRHTSPFAEAAGARTASTCLDTIYEPSRDAIS